MSIPDELYKYLDVSRLGILRDGLFRFTQPSEFNDLFEGRPYLEKLAVPDEIETLLEEKWEPEIRAAYELNPKIRSRMTFEHFKEIAETKKDLVYTLVQLVSPAIASSLSTVAQPSLDKSTAIFCLSSDPCSQHMWDRYASSSKGWAIGLDSSHQFFEQRLSENDCFRHLRKVEYRSVRRGVTLNDLDGTELLYVKADTWSYESEWRFVTTSDKAFKTMGSSEGLPVYLFKIPFSAFTSVVLGPRIEEKTREAILASIGSNAELQHVKFYQCILSKSEYKFELAEMLG